MPSVLVPPANPQFTPASGQLIGPADADPLAAASVNGAFQAVADRTLLAWRGLNGVQGSRMQASCVDGANIVINAQTAIRFSTRVYETLVATSVPKGVTVGSTTYYIYAWDNAGVLQFVVTTDAPNPGLRYRPGIPDQAFLTAFRTTPANNVRNFVQTAGKYLYEAEVPILAAGVAVVFAPIAISDIPPYANIVKIHVRMQNPGTTGPSSLTLKKQGAAQNFITLNVEERPAGVGTIAYEEDVLEIPTNGTVGLEYQWSLFVAGTFTDIFLLGYET